MSILYISHKLDEIKALCHHATILRYGKKVASVNVDEESTATLAAMMMGEALQTLQQGEAGEPGEIRLEARSLSAVADDPLGISLSNIELQLRAGEVVGIAGVAGNGQDELLAVLNGEKRLSERHAVMLEGKAVAQLGPNERRLAGLASVPEKRLGHGAVPDMDLVDNAFLTAFRRMKLIGSGMIDYRKTRAFSDQIIEDFSVKTPGSHVPAESLSGGNLQKFIIGRELNQNPEILLVAQPTWGVDAGAALTIRRALRERAAKGAAVLVISQDLDELMEITDRIGAICGGRLSTFYPTREMTVEKVGLLMAGVGLEQNDAA